MPTIEIVRRQNKQHRPGWLSIHIDGQDTEYMNDPAQHFKQMLARLVAAGRSPNDPQTTEEANHLADSQSKYVLQRIVNRIAAGKLFPGGMPASLFKATDQLARGPQTLQASLDDACQAFANRGKLAGLSEGERVERIKNRDAKTDHAAVWRENRKSLIAARNSELERAQRDLDGCAAQYRPKLQRRIESLQAEIAGLHVGIVNATHGFQYAYGQYLQGNIDFVGDDIRMVPLMTNTTVDTERDAKDQVTDFTTLDEADGSGYSSGGAALDNQAVNIDDSNDRAEVDADDETISSFGACTRSIQGLLVIKWVTNLVSSVPLHWLEFASNKTPDGSDFVLVMNAEGFIQAS
jgi:hypothetical protein